MISRRLVALVTVSATAAAVLAAAPAGPATAAVPDGWPQHGGAAANDNYQPDTGRLRVHRQLWQRQSAADDFVGGAAVTGGRLVVAYGSGNLRRVDVRTGAVTVLPPLKARRPAQLAVDPSAGGTLLVRGLDEAGRSRLAALDLAGAPRWEVTLPDDEAILPFTVAGGLVLLTSGPKCHDLCTGFRLRAYRVSDGTLAWSAAVDGDAGSAPQVTGATVVQAAYGPVNGTGDGSGGAEQLFAYDVSTGAHTWTRVRPGFSVAGWNGTLYAAGAGTGAGTGALCALDPSDGTERWCRPTPAAEEWVDGLSAGGGALYGYGLTATVRRYDPSTGAPRWAVPLALPGYEYNALHGSLVSGGGTVYGVVKHGNFRPETEFSELVALRAADGKVLRRIRFTGYTDLSAELMLLRDRLLVVGDRSVRAFG